MPENAPRRLKTQVHSLLNAEHFKKAIASARILCEQFPDDPECHLLLGAGLINAKKFAKAQRALASSVKRFPQDWRLQMLLGDVHAHQNNVPAAEESYRLALEIATDATPHERAELLCSIADTLWVQSRRADALDRWREALSIDPDCEEARESLAQCTNEYGEPKAPDRVFDDIYHFIGIQRQRYLRLVGRSEFATKDEAAAVMEVLMAGCNKHVTPYLRVMDTWPTEKKTGFFQSITLDFRDVAEAWQGERSNR